MADATAPLSINPETTALLVIDVLEGSFLGTDMTKENEAFGAACAKVVRACRKADIPVIHCDDAHIPGIDHELELWGPHGMVGTEADRPARLLGDCARDLIVPKRRYSGFFETDLDLTLRELGVATVIAIGADTNICVLHTLADAFYRNYRSIVVEDATMTFLCGTQEGALEHIRKCFGSAVVNSDELIRALDSADTGKAARLLEEREAVAADELG